MKKRCTNSACRKLFEAGPVCPYCGKKYDRNNDIIECIDFDVILNGYDRACKIKVMKLVRELIKGMGLAEVKTFVESAPRLLKESVTAGEAEEIKRRFDEIGGVILIKPIKPTKRLSNSKVNNSKVNNSKINKPKISNSKLGNLNGNSKAGYIVCLNQAGGDDINADDINAFNIKAEELVVEICGVDFLEAIKIVNSAPVIVKETVNYDEAVDIKKRFEKIGCSIDIKPFENEKFDVILNELDKGFLTRACLLAGKTNRSLTCDRKKLIESVPVVLKESVTAAEAEKMKKRFEELSCAVEIKTARSGKKNYDVIINRFGTASWSEAVELICEICKLDRSTVVEKLIDTYPTKVVLKGSVNYDEAKKFKEYFERRFEEKFWGFDHSVVIKPTEA